MATVSIDIFTGAYPTIANNIEIRVYTQADPLAIVTSLNHAGPHAADTWSFPGLDRTNYLFRIFEMSGSSIVRQLGGDMNIVPTSKGGVAQRATEQIEADVTPNFTSGVNTVTMDGTSGSPDWRGWDISTLDLMGNGPMKRGIDYSYDSATGQLVLLQPGDLFGPNAWFNVDFAAQVTAGTDSVPTTFPQFATPQIITANYSVSAGGDFGGLLIVKPAGNYLEILLPDIASVVAGKVLTIEMAPAAINKCGKVLTQAGQVIDWLQGNRPDLYMCPQESLSVYKFIDPSGPTSEYRVYRPFGNFTRVGEQIADDNAAVNVFNKVLFDGSSLGVLQYARLYNDFILNLPAGEAVDYDDWTTGNNKYKYSLANSSNPANAGKFMIPDRRGLVDKNISGARLPGDFEDAQVGAFNLTLTGSRMRKSGTSNEVIVMKNISDAVIGPADVNFGTINTGKENAVKNVGVRKYLLV